MNSQSHYVFCIILLLVLRIDASSSQLKTKSTMVEDEECDIVLEHGLCLYNGDKLLFADAKPEGLAGHWSFDDYRGLDSSGNHNHASSPIRPGPSMGGSAYSANIGQGNYITIPNSEDFNSRVFSITFWVFFIRDNLEDPESIQGLRMCPLLYKGNEDKAKNENARAPAILLDRKERTIKVTVSTTANDTTTEGESITSNSRLPFNRWVHIGVVRLDKKIRLYVNGILDSVLQTLGSTLSNDYPLYVGNTPWTEEECTISAYVDELRYYVRDLVEQEIEAEASPALGNMNPSFVQLGCVNCPITQAAESCIEGYHLCSTIELHSGVVQIARSLGWTKWNSRIWSFSATKQAAELTEGLGLGICCIN